MWIAFVLGIFPDEVEKYFLIPTETWLFKKITIKNTRQLVERLSWWDWPEENAFVFSLVGHGHGLLLKRNAGRKPLIREFNSLREESSCKNDYNSDIDDKTGKHAICTKGEHTNDRTTRKGLVIFAENKCLKICGQVGAQNESWSGQHLGW